MTTPRRVGPTGDSIAIAYAPLVAELPAGLVEVTPPPASAGDSANLLRHADEWVLRSPPDLAVPERVVWATITPVTRRGCRME